MNKIYAKYTQKIKKIILISFLLFSYNSYALDPIIDGCDETEYYKINDNNISGTDPYYITTISKDYNYNLSIGYEGYDCEDYDDFYLEIPGLPLHLACLGGGNRKYRLGETGMLKNMVGDTNYEIYLTQNVDDRRGIGRMYLCYNKITEEEKTEDQNQNILVGKEGFFETREDYITFMQIQLGLWFVGLILVMLYKILYFRK